MSADLAALAEEDYCYLTTTGRARGQAHELEIWFGIEGSTLYLLSGGRERSDWVRNLRRAPDVSLRIGESRFAGRARIVDAPEEHARVRSLLVEKYALRYSGDLSDWGRNALPVAVDLAVKG